MKILSTKLLFIALFCIIFSPFFVAAYADEVSYQSSRIKAAYTLHFLEFVDWPMYKEITPNDSAKHICILGNDLVGYSLAQLAEEYTAFKLSITKVSLKDDLNKCHILFMGDSDNLTNKMKQAIKKVQGKSVLTVSDAKGFADSGGIIGFIIIDNSIKFEINRKQATLSGLSINSKLLGAATRVIQ